MSPRDHDAVQVAIVGGGPAGAVVGMTLAREGVRAVVFEAAPAPQSKIGECLPPASAPLLNRLGLTAHMLDDPHLRSHGTRSVWGSNRAYERNFLMSVYGAGWHLDRCSFEHMLARVAMESGAQWHYASRVSGVHWVHDRWELTIKKDDQACVHAADFLVDATGRRATVARRLGARRVSYDRLVGVAAVLAPANGRGLRDTFTLVEAVPSGWWYSATLADGRLVMSYMTDHDLPEYQMSRRPDGWWRMLQQTRESLARTRECNYRFRGSMCVLPANSARLSVIIGERWLAIGDAAAAFDPLSSHGITTAMASGYYAAQAIVGLLNGHAEAGLAYLTLLDNAYGIYLTERRLCYDAEQRWPTHRFWSRRHSAG